MVTGSSNFRMMRNARTVKTEGQPCPLKRIHETTHEILEKSMIRYFCAIMLLCVTGCADSSPDPQEVLEKSRKTTAEVEKKLEAIQKSIDESKAKIEAMKQNASDPVDVKPPLSAMRRASRHMCQNLAVGSVSTPCNSRVAAASLSMRIKSGAAVCMRNVSS
jgi:hypothetical protein